MRDYSENAVMAKVNVLYGRRLRVEDYKELVHSKSVADVAGYLRNNTCYADTLAEVKEELIHRGQLETFVRRRNLNIYTSLLKYAYQDKIFLEMYMMENEIRQLLLAIRFLNAGAIGRYIVALPVYLSKYMSFDLFALAKVSGYDDILSIVGHSGYYNILTRFRPVSADRPVDITACEKALMEYYYRTLLKRVENNYSGAERKGLVDILHRRIDFHNLSVAYRLKRFFGYQPERIRGSMLDIKTGLSFSRAYDKLLNASDESEIDAALQDAYIAGKFRMSWNGRAKNGIFIQLERGRMAMSRKAFRFSVHPMLVAINYMFMLEIEVGNIVKVIEGIRYSIPPEDILRLVVF